MEPILLLLGSVYRDNVTGREPANAGKPPTGRLDARRLSPREQEVAVRVAAGLDNAEIARDLSLSRGTVADHVAKILRKLHARSRVQIAVWVTEQRLGSKDQTLG